MSHADTPVASLPVSQVTTDLDRASSSSPSSAKDPGLKVKVDNNNTLTSLYAHAHHTSAEGLSHTPGDNTNRKRSLDLSLEDDDVTHVTKKSSMSYHHLSPGLSSDTQSRSGDEQEDEEKSVGSAFRKVSSLASPYSPSIRHHSNTLSPDNGAYPAPAASFNYPLPLPPPILNSLQSMLLAKSAPAFSPLSMPRLPTPDAMFAGKLPTASLPPNIFALDGMQENIRKLLELGKTLDSRPQAQLAGLGGGADRRLGPDSANRLRAILPFYRPANPMVEKMLQATVGGVSGGGGGAVPFPPLNISQNWCAKCNASFRMTSDLVYHMRSHHSREHDTAAAATAAARKRRDDKLRCEFCGETFRERHHLTRHMTSHTEVRQA